MFLRVFVITRIDILYFLITFSTVVCFATEDFVSIRTYDDYINGYGIILLCLESARVSDFTGLFRLLRTVVSS